MSTANLHHAACILAAGAGRRMGAPKALLQSGGRTFIEQLLDAFETAGIGTCYVVGRHEASELRLVCEARGATFLENPQPELGMLSSIQVCVRAMLVAGTPRASGLFVAPVDCPRVLPATISSLASAHERTRAPLVLPRFSGRRGHPVLFDAGLFPELLAAPLDVGARAVVRAHAGDRLEIDVPDPAILEDIDTPADLAPLQAVR